MNTKVLASHLAVLLAGLLIGWWLPVGGPGTAPDILPATARHPNAKRPAANDNIRGSADKDITDKNETISSIQPEPGRHGESANTVCVPQSLISELSRAAGVRTVGQELFSSDSRIEEALRITDHEKARIQSAWEACRRRIRELEVATMKAEEIDEWTVRMTVPDLSSSMGALGDDFHTQIGSVLGRDRSGAFIAAKQMDAVFHPPAGEHTYTVTTEEIGDGRWRYRMTLEGPEGNRVWVGENIPDEIQHLTRASGVVPSLSTQ